MSPAWRPGERDPVPYESLDPGIRRVVRLLNDHGFVTTDSGDGVSKGEHGEPYGHVHMVLADDADMVSEARRLLRLIEAVAIPDPTGLVIQASYSPIDGLKTLSVFGVADVDLIRCAKCRGDGVVERDGRDVACGCAVNPAPRRKRVAVLGGARLLAVTAALLGDEFGEIMDRAGEEPELEDP